MKDRKIIFETYVGSHLYGTNRPDSDEDFQGVFIPSQPDLLGLQNCPTEWDLSKKISAGEQNAKGDIDRKFYSLKRFFHLASEGQPGQLEMMFASKEKTVQFDPIFSEILDNIGLFLSRKSIVPFIGFALAQAHKAVIKGENLNLIRDIVAWYDTSLAMNKSTTLLKHFPMIKNTLMLSADLTLKTVTNKEGFTTVEIAGRNYDVGLKLKTFVNNIKELEGRYGSRAKAAAENTYDYKSLMHAYRLLSEGEELLSTCKISLPRLPEEVKFLLSVRNGERDDLDHFAELTKRIDNIRQKVEPKSVLPKEPDYSGVNALCMDILRREVFK
jgi:predicted nucleotidyltransferase